MSGEKGRGKSIEKGDEAFAQSLERLFLFFPGYQIPSLPNSFTHPIWLMSALLSLQKAQTAQMTKTNTVLVLPAHSSRIPFGYAKKTNPPLRYLQLKRALTSRGRIVILKQLQNLLL